MPWQGAGQPDRQGIRATTRRQRRTRIVHRKGQRPDVPVGVADRSRTRSIPGRKQKGLTMTGYNAKVLAAPMPDRIKKLPISPQGYPVPWFVPWIGDDGKQSETGLGTPDFRMMDSDKFKQALKHNRCWICGELMGVFK